MENKEKQEILTFEKLQPEDFKLTINRLLFSVH